MTTAPADVVVFGAGFTGSRVATLAAATGARVVGTVRSEGRAASLVGLGFEVTREPVLEVAARRVGAGTHVIVTFPPDGETDALLAPLLAGAAAVSYVSTTGVYGDAEGTIDDRTPVTTHPAPSHARVLEAEALYRAVGATVLRAPGIYGPGRGLHVRVLRGEHRLPGAGENYTSRIHVDDLSALLLASRRVRGETFVVGDAEPARQCDFVEFLVRTYGCARPPSVPEEQVHETLRRNRRVDPRRALDVLGVTLSYPTYREGVAADHAFQSLMASRS